MSESRPRPRHRASKSTAHRTAVGALALLLAGPAFAPTALAQEPDADVRALIPLIEPADLPPPTAADFERAAAGADGQDIQALIPLVEPADLPPPTAADFERAAAEAEPPLSAEEIRKLTGKNLVKAPLAAALAGADRELAEALRELLAGRADRFVGRRDDRAGVEAFYRDRGFAPLWVENGAPSARAAAARRYIEGVEAHGFEPADYPVPHFAAGADGPALAETELRLTRSVLDYARHARTGRMHFSRLVGDIHYDLDAPDPAAVLAGLAGAADVATELDSYQPQHPQYLALKQQLAEARRESGRKDVVRVPAGPTLRPGMEDPRVATLRQRLEIGGDGHLYDAEVEAAVVAFQKGAGLTADGLAGPATLAALNGPADANKAETLLVNMERWRWLPRDLGRSYVTVNIPDFRLAVTRDGRPVWGTRIITGRLNGRETPLLSTAMRSITVNPTWNVPPSIIAKDYLPALQQDPSVMDRMGVRVEQNRDGTIRMYQPPGDNNALGRLRFNTPNQFLVYLHDTPDRKLFERDQRTFSAGCMRVQNPLEFAEVVLGIVLPQQNYTQERVRRLYGDNEHNINFPAPLPVHVTYQTAFVDEAGRLQLRRDVYGHDARMIGVLKGASRQVADVAVPKPKTTFSREELRLPSGVYYGAYGGGPYGRNPIEDFFRSIFR